MTRPDPARPAPGPEAGDRSPPSTGLPAGTDLGQLWREHRSWLAAVLLAHGDRDADLEDLLQEVAMAIVTRIHELRDPGAVRPWLRTVAVNVGRMSGRRENRRRDHVRPLDTLPAEPFDPGAATADHQLAEREDADGLLGRVGRLHADYREPLLLRCVEGMSQKRIAETLDLPETTVETRLARARRMLRRDLSASDDAFRWSTLDAREETP